MTIKHLNPPLTCDLCGGEIRDTFYDFRLPRGQWCNGYPKCFKAYGGRVGTGAGQKYERAIVLGGDDYFGKTAG